MKSSRKTPGVKTHKDPDNSPFSAPEGFWLQCPSCQEILRHPQLEANNHVCPECEHHFRIHARRRISMLFDESSFVEQDADMETSDVLGFVDSKTYPDRLKSAQEKTRLKDAFVSGEATLKEMELQVGAFEFAFMGGSMGMVVGEKVTRIFDRAYEKKQPAVVFQASGGARMQEGILSLMQMAKTSNSLQRLKDNGIPYISVLTDPTTGGVAASFAMLGDLNIAEPGALIGFAGPRVIAQTINEKLPENFQRSEFLLEHGMVDAIVSRGNMRDYLYRVLKHLL